jgi:hypothetical protein
MKRGSTGEGTMLYEKEGRNIEFQTPVSELAAVARVDAIQHKFLEPLRRWGEGVRHYLFGETMGRPVLAFLVKDAPPPDPKDVNAVIALFRKGLKDFPEAFRPAVLRDMNTIGYDIEDVDVMPPTDIAIQSTVPVNPVILYVKERDLACVTQQSHMSQGMFRALSIIIHLNYAILSGAPSCVLVDDIGEGLDFDRSCRLIVLLIEKASGSGIDLLMSSNDRFVMNKVPLEAWSVLQRQGAHVHVRNYQNSKEIFDEFMLTGLNNFDFLAMDFVTAVPQEEPAAHE